MPSPLAPDRRSGLSLVETLVAMAVFALGLLTLLPLCLTALRTNDTAAARMRALALAQAKLEDFRALSYPQIGGVGSGREALAQGYVREWGLTDAPSLPGDGSDLRRLWVTVSWGPTSASSVSLLASHSPY